MYGYLFVAVSFSVRANIVLVQFVLWLKHHFSRTESVVKAKFAQNNSQVSKGGTTVKPPLKPGQINFVNGLFEK